MRMHKGRSVLLDTDRVARVLLATDAVALSRHLNVAVAAHTPAGGPGVTDNPSRVAAAINAVTNEHDDVIEPENAIQAARAVENAALVILED